MKSMGKCDNLGARISDHLMQGAKYQNKPAWCHREKEFNRSQVFEQWQPKHSPVNFHFILIPLMTLIIDLYLITVFHKNPQKLNGVLECKPNDIK